MRRSRFNKIFSKIQLLSKLDVVLVYLYSTY